MRAPARSFACASCVRLAQRRAPFPDTTSSPVPKLSGQVVGDAEEEGDGAASSASGRRSFSASLSGNAAKGGAFFTLSDDILKTSDRLLVSSAWGVARVRAALLLKRTIDVHNLESERIITLDN